MTISIEPTYNIVTTPTEVIPQEEVSTMIANVGNHTLSRSIQRSQGLNVCEINGKQVFFVHKKLQEKINFYYARIGILNNLKLNPDTQILQVLGDCIPFSRWVTQKIKELLFPILEQPNQLVLWGYTGSQKDNGERLDINQIINTWVDSAPLREKQVLANIVDVDTPKALRESNCLGSQYAQNFYLVNGEAKFGEDILSSDSLTDKACCFDGGIQSFRQMVNLLSRDIEIQCYYGLRNEENMIRDNLFSAVEFIKFIKDNITPCQSIKNREVSNEFLESLKLSYLDQHILYSPEVKDPNSRVSLFQSAWELFLKKELWKKLDLCQILAI